MFQRPIVLIVDDDPTLRFVASKQMAAVGLHCELAENGAEALAKVDKKYDLIFMDLSMPVLDGIQATKKIREFEQQQKIKRTKIIGLTAFSEKERCLEAGMDDFIKKPLLLDQLRQIADELKNCSSVDL